MVPIKGPKIKMICGGANKGKVGWISAESTHTELSYRVIFAENENAIRIVRRTSVKILPNHEVHPSSYEDALIEQHEDIDLALDKVCAELAKCGITAPTPRLMSIFMERVRNAHSKQQSKGNKALYRHVEWYQDAQEESMNVQSATDEL
jgi:hypothetical protein